MKTAYLTIKEVLAALRLSRASYYRLVKAGKIHPRKIGTGPNGKILVPRSDVDAILGVVQS
jgi:excisionase family DNA binding protein